jgi:NAD(P)-dependent dehydrogenase (short-subunit alcohol dehydrogenase family)
MDMGALAGRATVLTGTSAGIGRAIALRLAPQRPRPVLATRNRARLESLAAAESRAKERRQWISSIAYRK